MGKEFDLRGVEVHGQDILSFMDALGTFASIGEKLLQDLRVGTQRDGGRYEILPGSWYPLTDKLRILEEVRRRVGAATLRRVGERIPDNAVFPPSLTDIRKAIASIDVAYHMNHRKDGRIMFDEQTGAMTDGIGHYGYRSIAGDDRIVSVCDSPNPSEYDEGILHAIARRFEPVATVDLDPLEVTRRTGGDSCTFTIIW